MKQQKSEQKETEKERRGHNFQEHYSEIKLGMHEYHFFRQSTNTYIWIHADIEYQDNIST